VITAVLAGSTAALAAILVFDHSLAAAVIAGALVSLPTLVAMIQNQNSAWERSVSEPLGSGED
jgi:ABC-type molybdate transport system permease subunit